MTLGRIALGIVLLFADCFSISAWAQQQGPESPAAGLVTNLAGRVTVARRIIPQPLDLKFKDPVFVGDTVRTAKQSVARLLLGGKAVVTVRELSELIVKDEAGRSTVDM